jgi:hypothetical protein
MRFDDDGLPLIGSQSKCLGVHVPPNRYADIDLDNAGNVVLNRKSAKIMNTCAPAMNQAYLEYASRLLQHHRLLAEGSANADETVAVEDEMTGLWEELDSVQRKSLSGLGSDLNWIRHGGSLPPLGSKPDNVSSEGQRSLVEARNASEWHEVLHQLRVCAPYVPPSALASLRAEAWAKIGLLQIARAFSDFASRLDPNRGEELGQIIPEWWT